jgi:hypothetical protein
MVDSIKVPKGIEPVSSTYRVKKTDRQYPDTGQKKFEDQTARKKKKKRQGQEVVDDIVDLHSKTKEPLSGKDQEKEGDEGAADDNEHRIDIRI